MTHNCFNQIVTISNEPHRLVVNVEKDEQTNTFKVYITRSPVNHGRFTNFIAIIEGRDEYLVYHDVGTQLLTLSLAADDLNKINQLVRDALHSRPVREIKLLYWDHDMEQFINALFKKVQGGFHVRKLGSAWIFKLDSPTPLVATDFPNGSKLEFIY